MMECLFVFDFGLLIMIYIDPSTHSPVSSPFKLVRDVSLLSEEASAMTSRSGIAAIK